MKTETAAYLLSVLDTQYAHIVAQSRISKATGERQRLFYNGMRVMFEAAITDGYTDNARMLFLSADGRHSICERPEIDQFPAAKTDPESRRAHRS